MGDVDSSSFARRRRSSESAQNIPLFPCYRKVIIAHSEMIYSYHPLYTTERLIGLLVLLQWREISRGRLQ